MEASAAGHAPRREWLDRLAGPALIVAAVLTVLHGFWLSPRLTNQQVDQLAFWLPRWCFLGTNLAHGHLPTWLPNQFGGVPFLSDPQSGWLNLPAMALFSATSCARALGLFVTLQPILAGLGLYWFFRNERVGRAAATVGGLTLALIMAGSAISLSVPFSGTLAWTALSLAGAAGYLHAESLVRRLAWLVLTELCLAQVAAVHLTDGLVLAVLVLFLYLVARSVAQVRAGARTVRTAAVMIVGLFAAFPLLAAAILVPRLALLPRTSIGRGYVELGRLANTLSGTSAPAPLAAHGVGPWWGTAFARGPGGYAGAIAVLLLPVAFVSRRWRLPALAFAVAGLIGWVLNLDVLVASTGIRSFALKSSLGELWLRDPFRFRYLVPLAVAALAGYAVQGWLDMAMASGLRGVGRRLLWIVPSVAVLVALPLVAGSTAASYVPLLAGSAVALPVLLAAATGKGWAVRVIPVVAAIELAVVALASQGGPASVPRREATVARDAGLGRSFAKLHAPTIVPTDYLAPGPIAQAMGSLGTTGRYLTFDPAIAADPANPRGFLFYQQPEDWPAYENGRSILFGLDEVQGYSPIQLLPYWTLIRRVDTSAPIYYNAAHLQRLDPAVPRLFAVEWLIQPSSESPGAGGVPVAREGRYTLSRLRDANPRASVVSTWQIEPLRDQLHTVLAPEFEPEREAVLARAHGTDPPEPPTTPGNRGRASYRELSPDHVRITTSSDGPGVLVVRNAYDRNWVATVDGREQPVLVADYLMQGVPVPGGTHVVDLRYRDDTIGVGLVASGVSWSLLGAGLLMATRRARRRMPTGSGTTVPSKT